MPLPFSKRIRRWRTVFTVVIFCCIAFSFISKRLGGQFRSSKHGAHQHTFPTSNETLSHPSDYTATTVEDEWCADRYGPRHLEYIASHHVQYCDHGSRSTLECFRNHRSDSFCLARGVAFEINRTARKRKAELSLHCQLRDFKIEANVSDEAALALQGVENVEDMDYTGVKRQLQLWDIEIPNSTQSKWIACDAENNDKEWTLLVQHESGSNKHNIWHNLMELSQVMISLDALQMAIDPLTHRPYLTANDMSNMQIVLEDEGSEGSIEELWTMPTGNKPIFMKDVNSTCLGNVIVPLAGWSSPFWYGHFHWQGPQEQKDCKDSFMLDAFLRRVYRHLGIKPRQRLTEGTVVTIIDRKQRRRIFELDNHVKLLQQRYPNITVQVVDLSTLNIRDQIQLMGKTDVLMGVTGAGLAHIMFLPPESSVAEILPPNIAYAGWRNLAKMRDLPYFRSHSVTEAALEVESESKLDSNAHSNNSTGIVRRNWQTLEWIYMTDEAFQTLADAAIRGQNNRGLRSDDVI